MHNTGKIILLIIALLIVFSSPFWVNAIGGAKDKPELKYPKNAKECLLPKGEMASKHMDILNEWRHKVVRNDDRNFEFKGKLLEMSLTNTCLDCHESKEDFCDECHTYLDVNPYCWDCHVTNQQGSEFDLEKFKSQYMHLIEKDKKENMLEKTEEITIDSANVNMSAEKSGEAK